MKNKQSSSSKKATATLQDFGPIFNKSITELKKQLALLEACENLRQSVLGLVEQAKDQKKK